MSWRSTKAAGEERYVLVHEGKKASSKPSSCRGTKGALQRHPGLVLTTTSLDSRHSNRRRLSRS